MKKTLITILAVLMFFTSSSAPAQLTSAQIIPATLSYPCVRWVVVGICIWLTCKGPICWISTSVKIAHFNPETVVSSYASTGLNPWSEMALYGTPIPGVADGMGTMFTPSARRENQQTFRNVDVIGHPGSITDMGFGMLCDRATIPFVPYFISTLDVVNWRWGISEQIYPASYIPGLREVQNLAFLTNWGSVFPRQGFLTQPDGRKASAVMAQRGADITSNIGSPHVYIPTRAIPRQGYWPPGPIIEGNPLNHGWQELWPNLSLGCSVFPTATTAQTQMQEGYAWALWRPYACCPKVGSRLIFSTPSPYH